ncbi:MAG: SUMF1/EgtB/PvdO family nonheme iron enzyme [Treponema sp.]|jgi:formylglycine-generating enzyme required for sulfatase activity|nr:SUMF1/EgtB/PvdO family nonheme iron enzyme [Treponema sp.]
MKKGLLFVLAALIALAAYGQKKESLALLPFTGGQTSDGEYIVQAFARQRELREAFNKVTLITRTTQAFMQFEQRFQRMSGLTDADTIFELGKQLNATHVIAGYITKLGNQNLVLVSILDVESLQQIAGDYRTYANIEEVAGMIPGMAKNLARYAARDTSELPGLSVPPFDNVNGVNESDAQVLAQILAIGLANGNAYTVLPRTDSLAKVLEEHRRQRTGETDHERVRRLGRGRNAQYVLASSAQRLGSLTSFTADVLNIQDGSYKDGAEEQYRAFSEGIDLMPKLAAALNGTPVSGGGGSPPPANMVRIAGGTFTMGSPASEAGRYDNEIQHTVRVSSFYLGKYEVTQKEWRDVMGTNPSRFKGDNLPVEQVSWFDAIEYCNKRSVKEGLTPAYTISGSGDSRTVSWNRAAGGYRLPTEAEWEYACRAGSTTAYNTGAGITTSQARYGGSYGGSGERDKTIAVGSFAPNAWGLYDMYGNVWEWCWDWYGGYSSGSQTNPAGASSGSNRVARGGSWNASVQYVRSAGRYYGAPSGRYHSLGFRVLRPQM